MLSGWKSFSSLAWRQAMRLSRATARLAARKVRVCDPQLLDVVWESLNIARDNKALVLAKHGTILNINALAQQLCGRSEQELLDTSVTSGLLRRSCADTARESLPLPASFFASALKWKTRLRRPS